MSSWLTFVVAVLAVVIILYLPGFIALTGRKHTTVYSFVFAPLISLFLLVAAALLYGYTGVKVSGLSLSLFSLIAAFILFLIFRLFGFICSKGKSPLEPKLQSNILLCYLFMGLLITTVVFVKNLDGPNSFMQAWDNVYHLSTIKSFVETGKYASIDVSPYAQNINTGLSPFIEGTSFYPALWHELCAIVVSIVDAPIPLVINAVNTVLIGVVFPASCYVLFSVLNPDNKKFQQLGSLVCLAFVGFPWRFVTVWGPLYPNMTAYVLLPLVSALFISFLLAISEKRVQDILFKFFFLICAAVVLAFSHPNSIFTAVVFLSPLLFVQIGRWVEQFAPNKSNKFKACLQGAFLIFIICFWITCYNLDAFAHLLSFNWSSWCSSFQAIINIVTMSFTDLSSVDFALTFCVLVGVYALVTTDRNNSWLLVSFVIASIMYTLSVSTESALKHFLTGFWYTDYMRIIAVCCICALPISVYGIERIYRWLVSKADTKYTERFVFISYSIVLVFVLFIPSFSFYGLFDYESPFGILNEELREENLVSGPKVLDVDEIEFAQQVMDVVPEDALILNSPNDGSTFLYSLIDMNVFYRTISGYYSDNETAESQLIRLRLDEYGQSEDVTNAVENLGISYVLILDSDGSITENSPFLPSYYPADWTGFNQLEQELESSSPFFEVILQEGDMRLIHLNPSV